MKKSLTVFTTFALLSFFLINCSPAEVDITPSLETEAAVEAPDTPVIETPDVPEVESVPCNLPLPGPGDWPVVLCEQFDDNRNNWEVESQDNPYASYTSLIEDGKFSVNYSAKGFGGFQKTALTWFSIGEVKDFALSITGQMESGFRDASWGIAFRGNGDSFFLFSIRNNGAYVLEIYENGEWLPLITPKEYNGIKLDEENTLRIEAIGQDFFFTINDVTVNQFSGGLLIGDKIQLIVSAKEGVRAVFTFDDIVLQK